MRLRIERVCRAANAAVFRGALHIARGARCRRRQREAAQILATVPNEIRQQLSLWWTSRGETHYVHAHTYIKTASGKKKIEKNK